MQLSYWEKEAFFKKCDVCIIGSGIVGLSAAIECRRRFPKAKVIILERGFLPYGASTRNAGFACFGSVTELKDDLKNRSLDEVGSLAIRRFKGLINLRKLLGDEAIGYENFGGYEVFDDPDSYEEALDLIPDLNAVLKEGIGETVFRDAPAACSDFGFRGIRSAVFNQYESQIHTGKMMESLLDLARKEGVRIFNGIGVDSVKDAWIETDQGFGFRSGKVIVTVNGFAKQLLPDLQVEPARAQVVVTTPIDNLSLKGTFHYDRGYYYFRNLPDNRVLLGGGRNLDFEAEKTYSMEQSALVIEKLTALLKDNILPGKKFTIDMQWSGIMGVGDKKEPIIREVDRSVFVAVRMGGMGVAIGSLVGKEVAGLL